MAEPSACKCCLCWELYDFETPGGQAVALPCGHSFCRSCLEQVRPQRCPACRTAFSGDVSGMGVNYTVKELISDMVKAPDPLAEALKRIGVEDAGGLLIPAEQLVLGEVISAVGAAGSVRGGTLNGVQASGNCVVAVKVIHLDSDDPEDPVVKSLYRELLVIRKGVAACPHVCRYLGVTKKDSDFCIVMQLYKQSLDTYIQSQPGHKLCLSEALHMGMSIARGLSELHAINVIACDLKPGNVLLSYSNHAVLCDFGISHCVSATLGHVVPEDLEGTLNFMAPEQIDPGNFDISSTVTNKVDIWAFACTLINMLTGHPPLHERNFEEIKRTVTKFQVAHKLPTELPPTLVALLRSCLHYDPAARPTAANLLHALRSVMVQDSVSTSAAAKSSTQITSSHYAHQKVKQPSASHQRSNLWPVPTSLFRFQPFLDPQQQTFPRHHGEI
ncbi:MAG: hypothetical protein WDW38_008728 [Sanguina aurantia]